MGRRRPRVRVGKRGYTRIAENGSTTAVKAKRSGRRSPRAAFPGRIPKALKRKGGRTDVPLIPAHIRVLGANLRKEQRMSIRRKLARRLGKFADSMERVTVRVKDVNGPRGGIDQLCRIKVVLSRLPSVVVEARDAFLTGAVAAALSGTERAVRRRVRRRRMKPIKVGVRSRAGAT